MKKRIAVITNDFYLYQKIRLTLADTASVDMKDALPESIYDTVIADKDYKNVKCDISIGRQGECDLKIPFTYDALRAAVLADGRSLLSLSETDGCAVLRGKRIKLTELEYSLLSYLINKGGFADKGELLSNVWKGISNEGIINVYIHYLREKLEKNGERIIICSRGQGYKIDEKYLKGERDADTY